jgi:hypothetical protein
VYQIFETFCYNRGIFVSYCKHKRNKRVRHFLCFKTKNTRQTVSCETRLQFLIKIFMSDSDEPYPAPPQLIRSDAVWSEYDGCAKCGSRVCELCAYAQASDCFFTNAQSLPVTVRRSVYSRDRHRLPIQKSRSLEPRTRVLAVPLHDGLPIKNTRAPKIHISERDSLALRTVLDCGYKHYQMGDSDQLFYAASMHMIQQVIKSGWRTRVLISLDVLDGCIRARSSQPDYRERPQPVLNRMDLLNDIDYFAVTLAFSKRGMVFSMLFSPNVGVFYVIELHETYEFGPREVCLGSDILDPFN